MSENQKGFKEVSRTAASAGGDMLDPLSMFAREEPKPPPAPLNNSNNNKYPSLGGTSSSSSSKSTSVQDEFARMEQHKSISPTTNKQSNKTTVLASTASRSASTSPIRGGNISSPHHGQSSYTAGAASNIPSTPAPYTTVASSSSNYNAGNNSTGKDVSRRVAIVENDASSDEPGVPLLTGEQKVMSLYNAYIQVSPGVLLPGVLYTTTYRYAFILEKGDMKKAVAANPSIVSWLQVPLASIDRIEKEKRPKDGYTSGGITIVVTAKDVRTHRITIRTRDTKTTEADIDRALGVIAAYAFPNKMRYLFAFSHNIDGGGDKLRYKYNAMEEMSRLGVLDSPLWRLTEINRNYKFCHSYPKEIFVPKSMTDHDLQLVGSFRSEHRIPLLSWYDSKSCASMWRSSQPKCGVSGSNSQDEKFLDMLARSTAAVKGASHTANSSYSYYEPLLNIVDLRSRASAMANRAAGAGYESQTSYTTSRLEWYGIPNIHAMRDSVKGICNIVLNPTAHATGDVTFSKQVEETQWLTHVRTVLKTSWDTADFLAKGSPVLVHCSHGWDRTAQVCALAQLLVDPFYRTMDGFRVLIDKEWCAYGHPFQIRCGHSQDHATRAGEQVSPIFLQFLDCVWQLVRQYSPYFEFNTRYVLTIADHIYSGRFGNFLFNNDADREGFDCFAGAANIWMYLDANRSIFANPLCNPRFLDVNNASRGRLNPPISGLLRNVTLWTDYFLRWSSVPSIMVSSKAITKYLYNDSSCVPLREAAAAAAGASCPPPSAAVAVAAHQADTGGSDAAETLATGEVTAAANGDISGAAAPVDGSSGADSDVKAEVDKADTTAAAAAAADESDTINEAAAIKKSAADIIPAAAAAVVPTCSQRSIDIRVPPLVGFEDKWEGAYRIERERRMALEQKYVFGSDEVTSSSAVPDTFCRNSNSYANAGASDAERMYGRHSGDEDDDETAPTVKNNSSSKDRDVKATEDILAMELSSMRFKVERLLDLIKEKGGVGISDADVALALASAESGDDALPDATSCSSSAATATAEDSYEGADTVDEETTEYDYSADQSSDNNPSYIIPATTGTTVQIDSQVDEPMVVTGDIDTAPGQNTFYV